jgi:hypothetical protein
MFRRSPSATGPGQQRGILQHRLAFAGERRLQQLQRCGLRQTCIGAHSVALGEHQYITPDEFGAGHTGHCAIAQHGQGGGGHLRQCRHRLRRLGFLKPAQHGVQHDHKQDDDGVQRPARRAWLAPPLKPPRGQGNERRRRQQVNQWILHLRQRAAPYCNGWLRAQFIRAVVAQPLGSGLDAEATFQVGAERQSQLGDISQ